ncbi:triphosphoribosyl-dephospho-CoA synthase [Methanobrevibacter olleyae]|uniref:ATP:dephospho-CoA triphosphoribosyl transferase CitG n=1 Tax=Methanobrevibacter olleyae TaxID=294671 RepID=A0A126R0L2_METOL|nr:triphosphoribosyl-dephospho-CoA synthase [Methanobrevibacter olleyae]AMK15602.1 ATP:dephospho-CoA triphosphoribosyl transferase CitG [Methanobrevibacter olleyae]SFL74045.1 triphosphoribosyl-dephospho-CoA synthase [Methanobrevibacter olleyae]
MEAKEIAKLAQIASVLEVSGWPKPGNVHRTRNYDDMVFEDFIISGVVIGNTVEELANQSREIDDLSNAELGKYILQAVNETDKWIANNTNLGIMMMCIPIASAAAISNNFDEIQENVGHLMKSTTVEDAVNLYDAINVADAGGMGNHEEFDVMSEKAKDELRTNNQTMFDVLEISASWDRLANELTNRMPVCFDIGYPTFSNFLRTCEDVDVINKATVLTFITILSQIPDTLISRKYGDEIAESVSKKADEVLKFKDDGSFVEKLLEFDDYLYENNYNPGTTADLTATSIFISYLEMGFNSNF